MPMGHPFFREGSASRDAEESRNSKSPKVLVSVQLVLRYQTHIYLPSPLHVTTHHPLPSPHAVSITHILQTFERVITMSHGRPTNHEQGHDVIPFASPIADSNATITYIQF